METLFDTSKFFQKERPKKPTQKQVDEFYSNMADEIIENEYSEYDKEDIISDLKKIYPFNQSGYELAKELESYGMSAEYNFTTDFIEWLEDLSYQYGKVNEVNVKEWVKCHKPIPKFSKGQKLIIKSRLCHGFNKDKVVYVNGFREEFAQYLIDENPNKNGGTILDYELVESNCEITE